MKIDLTQSPDRAGIAHGCLEGLIGTAVTALAFIDEGRPEIGAPLLRVAVERAKGIARNLNAGYAADVARIQKVNHDQA